MASMKEYGIKKILTDDKDFREIEGIEVVEMRDD